VKKDNQGKKIAKINLILLSFLFVRLFIASLSIFTPNALFGQLFLYDGSGK